MKKIWKYEEDACVICKKNDETENSSKLIEVRQKGLDTLKVYCKNVNRMSFWNIFYIVSRQMERKFIKNVGVTLQIQNALD